MKKKLALLMAAIMTVAMVPMTAFASTKLTAVDEIATAVDDTFESRVELVKNDDQVNIPGAQFDVILKLTNGEFATDDDDDYIMEYADYLTDTENVGIVAVDVRNATTAVVTLDSNTFNGGLNNAPAACVLTITAKAVDTGDVIAKFTSNVSQFKKASEAIATAYDGDVTIESDGVITFVEDSSTDRKNIKDITITGLTNGAVSNGEEITLKLKGNYEFNWDGDDAFLDEDGGPVAIAQIVTCLNDACDITVGDFDEDELHFTINNIDPNQVPVISIGGFAIKTTKDTDPGDVAKLTISSKDFDSNTLEVARMVEEAVTYTVEDDDLPTIWAGKDYTADDETNTLEVAIEENTGDILNTSRKATFTFPDGIEVVDIEVDDVEIAAGGLVEGEKYGNVYAFEYEIDENVVTIWNYGEDEESDATDMKIKFILNAAPTFEGDVDVTLGGEFDDVELTVATVKAPYTVEAKTSEVLIDYRYVPVNEIVITEAEEGILAENDVIMLQVEKMDFEDAGTYEVTSGDIEVDVTIEDGVDDRAQLEIKDDSTEASTITISGLELYLDRTLPVGGYALDNVGAWGDDEDVYNNDRENFANNILWENSSTDKDEDDNGYDVNGIFKYDAVTVNDSYVEVVTAGRDQDDSSTTRKIVITIGATTMAVGTETVTLDTPAYINAENYTELPLRAVSEAFGATVGWDDASRTVTIMMGQRIVSMTIGSKTMYINGTPVAMNTAPEITNERTFVPVRDLANALGITKIDWNEASATVTLN